MNKYIVKLNYFKRNGKYYSSGEYESQKSELYDIFDEVQTLCLYRCLPGLIDGHSDFIVSVDVPGHANNYPHLINAR